MTVLFDAQNPRSHDPLGLRALFDSCYCAMDYGTAEEQAPWGMQFLRGVNFGGIDVYEDTVCGAIKSRRTRQHILHDSAQDYLILIPTLGSTTVLQRGEMQQCQAGSFMLLSTAIPFSGCNSARGLRGQFSKLSVRLSGAMLQQLMPRIDDLSNRTAQLRPGAGKLMKSLLEAGLAEGGCLSAAQARDFGGMLLQSVANAIREAPEFAAQLARPNLSGYARIQEAALDHIARNLSDAALSCKQVAQHCRVSERHLRAAFETLPFGVSGYIRELRLQQCRAALQDPALADRSVIRIAESWGFADPSSFNRIYKTRFGMTPGKERDAATAHLN